MLADQFLSVFGKDTGWIAGCVPDDFSTFRTGGLSVDIGKLQGTGIDQGCMAAGVREKDRIVRRHPTEQMVGLKAFDHLLRRRVPFALVPAPAENPFPGRYSCGSGFYNIYDFFIVFCLTQI